MRVADAATTNAGVWLTFVAVTLLYAALGTTLILVLRGMSRRARAGDRFDDTDSPYGPPEPTEGAEVRAR
jgi:cytochrome d ubiquinol oxidase subunit I